MEREFRVKTPLGDLLIYAKHETDNPKDFPGVFIDFVHENGENEMLACVEFDSCAKSIQTCVYALGLDEPVFVTQQVRKEVDDEEAADVR